MNRDVLRKIGIGLVVLIGVGLLVGTYYMDRKEQKHVQASVENLQKEDKLDMKKSGLDSKDQEWQRKLEKKKNGNSNVVILADNIEQSLYDTVYKRMQELNWLGVMVLTDGEVPGGQAGSITREQFDEMVGNGWNYAFSVSTSIEEKGVSGWLSTLDQNIAKWEKAGIANSGIAVCQVGQYSESDKEEIKQALSARGFRALFIIYENDISLAGAYEDSWNEMESVLLREDYSNVTTMMNSAMNEGKSMSVTIGKVTEQPRDTGRELSPAKFERFINQMYDMQDKGYKVLSYTDYESDRKETNGELAQMQKEYEAFLQEKEQKLKELEK